MPSYYTIAQYVPDPAREERINIGVLAFSGGSVRHVFLDNWHRVRQFAGRDIGFLKEFARDARSFDETSLRKAIMNWVNTIQFTQPSASLLNPDDLLIEITPHYLIDEGPAARGYRVKGDAVDIMRRRVREKLIDRLGPAGRMYLKDRNYPLNGIHRAYQFDLSVGNGTPVFAAQGISFEMPEGKVLDKEIGATAWLVQDVKENSPDLPIGVVYLSPKAKSESFQEALDIFKEKGAELVSEDRLSEWATRMVEKIPHPKKVA